MSGIQLRQSPTGASLLGTQTGQVVVWNNSTESWQVSSGAVDAACFAVQGFTSAAIAAALASGAYEVCFPAGVYEVTSLLTQTLTDQVLNFQPGAVLRFAAGGAGRLVVSGVGAQITGYPVARWDAASTASYVAIDMAGQASQITEQLRLEFNANVPNCTPVRLSGDYSQCDQVVFAGSGGSFKIGVDLAVSDSVSVNYARTGLLLWQMADDGQVHTYQSLVRFRSVRSSVGGVQISVGIRNLFSQIIDHVGQHNELRNPQVNSSQASPYAILMRDGSEFLDVFGGELVGNYLANSVGIQCGDGSIPSPTTPAAGQLRCYGTKVRNWDIGVKFTGSCDTPEFYGGFIGNNQTAQVQVDSQRGADVWSISGLGFFGVYCENAAFPNVPFLHLKSGRCIFNFSACEIGFIGAMVQVDAGMSENVGEIGGGSRFGSGGAATDALTLPNTNSNIFVGRNFYGGVAGGISKGAFATKTWDIDNPRLTTALVLNSFQVATTGDPITALYQTFFTCNFAAGVGANSFVELDFAWNRALLTKPLYWSVVGAPASNTSLLFFAYVKSNGTATLRAWNLTAVAVGAVNGSVFFLAPYL